MDPISVLGVVSAVITFIDFSRTLVTGAKELYQNPDGTVDTNADLKAAQHLHQISTGLCTEFPGDSDAEKQIRAIANDCYEESKTLINLLEKFRVRQKTNKLLLSLKRSWQMWRTRSDVKKSKDRLREYQSQMMIYFMLMLQDDSSKVATHIKTLENTCNILTVELPKQFNTLRNDLIQASKEHIRSESSSTTKILALIHDMQSKTDEIDAQIFILEILEFSDIRSRYKQIYTARKDTCGWIFGHDPPSRKSGTLGSGVTEESITRQFKLEEDASEKCRKTTSHEFISWLRHGQSIFYISGKAGSGKSTLMKFIASHDQTHKELQVWAGEKTLVTGDFYFWNPGTTLQMTLDGLYRTLLFTVLSRCPEMIKEVFPSEWNHIREGDLLNSRRRYERQRSRNITDPNCTSNNNRPNRFSTMPRASCDFNFERAFELLIRKSRHARHRFCFFIDGNKLDHESLAQKMKVWTEGGDVKICASSRPYREFHTVLSSPQVSRISLHLLNRFDIWTYCVRRFSNDREAGKMKESYMEIINDIAVSSQGVFLWAYLVVDIILLAIRQDDPYHILLKKLGEIPKELDLLYAKLREPIEKSKIDKERSDKMLLLATMSPLRGNLRAIVFSWLDGMDGYDLENPNFPDTLDYSSLPYSEREYIERVNNVEKKIDSLTRGFLELNSEPVFNRDNTLIQPWLNHPQVQFSHRTARDYFLQSKGMMKTLEESFYGFKWSNPYGRLCLAEFIFGFRDLSNRMYQIINFTQWLARLLPEHLDDKICREFQHAVQRLRPWLFLSLQGHHHPNPSEYRSFEIPPRRLEELNEVHSFFCIGYCMVDIELPFLDYPKLLLDALGRKDWLSTAEHITDSTVLDFPICVSHYTPKKVTSWPLWTIISIFIIHHQFSNHDYANKDIYVLNQALHDHAIRNADDFRFQIRWCNDDIYGWGKVHWRVLMNILELAGKLEKGEFNSLIQCQDIGMLPDPENEAILRACKERGTFFLSLVSWKGAEMPFQSTTSRNLDLGE